MSGTFSPFPSAGSGVGGSVSVDGNGLVANVDGLLFGYPVVGRGGIIVENSDARDGPLTIWRGSERVLIAAEDLDCSSATEIELGPCAREGLDTVIIDEILFWGASASASTLRASLWSGSSRTGVQLVSATQSYAALTTVDSVLTVKIPEAAQRPSRYPSLWWNPSTPQALRLNMTVLCKPLRAIQKSGVRAPI